MMAEERASEMPATPTANTTTSDTSSIASDTPRYFPHTKIRIPSPIALEDPVSRFLSKFPPTKTETRKRTRVTENCGRPRKDDKDLKRPRYNPRAKPTKLRANKPVATAIPCDIWYTIFVYTEPKTLLTLKTTCKAFHEILSEDGLWKRNRQHHHGDEARHYGYDALLPPLLPSHRRAGPTITPYNVGMMAIQDYSQNKKKKDGVRISEADFTELIEGHGCMTCDNKKAARTQWAFLRRWCNTCYQTHVIQLSEMKSVRDVYADLLSLIPCAWNDTWGGYDCVSFELNDARQNFPVHYAYKRNDVARIIKDWELFAATEEYRDADQEKKQTMYEEWKQPRLQLNQEYLESAQRAEFFVNSLKLVDLREQFEHHKGLIGRRHAYFNEKAAQLNPPLNSDTFKLIPGWAALVSANHEPTERAWRCFLPKIEKYRRAAEDQSSRESDRDPINFSHQAAYTQAEEKNKVSGGPRALLNEFADGVLEELAEAEVAPEDFTFLFLRGIYEKYKECNEKPKAREWDLLDPGEGNSYTLCMMDAMQVYKRKAIPVMRQWTSANKIKGMHHKCPGCVRTDYSKDWCLRPLLMHLREKHGSNIGSDFSSWHITGLKYLGADKSKFPWLAIKWPKNFPLLAPHHTPTGRWNPDEEEYTEAPNRGIVASVSPFDGRSVRLAPGPAPGTLHSEDMAANLSFAEQKLKGLPIGREYKTLIAWKYAVENLDKFGARKRLATANSTFTSTPTSFSSSKESEAEGDQRPDQDQDPDNNTLSELSLALILAGEFSVLQELSCSRCLQSSRYIPPRVISFKLTFDELVDHWRCYHLSIMPPPNGRASFRAGIDASGLPISPRSARRIGHTEASPIDKDCDWRRHMISLPEELALADLLNAAGSDQLRCVFDELFPLTASRGIIMVNGLDVLADEAAKVQHS